MDTITTFRIGSKVILDRLHGRGWRTELAKYMGVSQGFVSKIFNKETSAINARHMDLIAGFIGMPVKLILEIGTTIQGGGEFDPISLEVSGTAPHTVERAERLYRMAAKEVGVNDEAPWLASRALGVWDAPGLDKYLSGGIKSDVDFFEMAKRYLSTVCLNC